MLPTVDVDNRGDEDETGDVQVIGWRDPFAKHCRVLGSQVVEIAGRVSRRDGTTNVIEADPSAVQSGSTIPTSMTATEIVAVPRDCASTADGFMMCGRYSLIANLG